MDSFNENNDKWDGSKEKKNKWLVNSKDYIGDPKEENTQCDLNGIIKNKVKYTDNRPRMYQIWLLCSDKSKESLIRKILEQHFHYSYYKANKTVADTQQHGCSMCGSYTKDVVDTKIREINNYLSTLPMQSNSIRFVIQRGASYVIKKS